MSNETSAIGVRYELDKQLASNLRKVAKAKGVKVGEFISQITLEAVNGKLQSGEWESILNPAKPEPKPTGEPQPAE